MIARPRQTIGFLGEAVWLILANVVQIGGAAAFALVRSGVVSRPATPVPNAAA